MWSNRMEKTMTHAEMSFFSEYFLPVQCQHVVVPAAGCVSLQDRLLNNLWLSGKCAVTDSFDSSRFRPEQVLLLLSILYSSYENSTRLLSPVRWRNTSQSYFQICSHRVCVPGPQALKQMFSLFPDDLPTCSCYSQPPTRLILFLCACVFL